MDMRVSRVRTRQSPVPTMPIYVAGFDELHKFAERQARIERQRQREQASHLPPRRSKKHAWKVARAAGRAA